MYSPPVLEVFCRKLRPQDQGRSCYRWDGCGPEAGLAKFDDEGASIYDVLAFLYCLNSGGEVAQ